MSWPHLHPQPHLLLLSSPLRAPQYSTPTFSEGQKGSCLHVYTTTTRIRARRPRAYWSSSPKEEYVED